MFPFSICHASLTVATFVSLWVLFKMLRCNGWGLANKLLIYICHNTSEMYAPRALCVQTSIFNLSLPFSVWKLQKTSDSEMQVFSRAPALSVVEAQENKADKNHFFKKLLFYFFTHILLSETWGKQEFSWHKQQPLWGKWKLSSMSFVLPLSRTSHFSHKQLKTAIGVM